MFRFALLIVLPLAALCLATPEEQREQALKYLEAMKPCILHKLNCPPGGGMDLSHFEPIIRLYHRQKTPQECKCDLSTESCNRRCYYAFVMMQHMISAAEGKTDAAEIAEAQDQMRAMVERIYRPCIFEGKNCEILGGLDYPRLVAVVAKFVKQSTLPEECDCDIDTETCVRQCYYSYLKMSILNPPWPSKKRQA